MLSRGQQHPNPNEEEPFVDLEELIHKAAWKTILMPRNFCCFQRPCKQAGRKLMVLWNALETTTTAELHDVHTMSTKMILYETAFDNRNSEDQVFNFQAERCTESNLEMSVQSGVTIGQNMKCSFSITIPGSPVQMGGTLGKDIKWDNKVTEKYNQNEKLTWGVNAPVTVKSGKRAIVRLSVIQEQIEGDLTIRTTASIISKNNKLPVYAVTGKDNKLVACANVGVNTICKQDNLHLIKDDDKSFHYESHARFKSKYCIRQHVSIDLEDVCPETP